MRSAMKKAAGASRQAGAGIARKLGVAADNYVYQMIVIIVGALWQLFKIFLADPCPEPAGGRRSGSLSTGALVL